MSRPDGWHPLPQTPEHAMRDGLFIASKCVATVEAFADEGPWYANAILPSGEPKRYGACESNAGAAAWCERVTGHRAQARLQEAQNAARTQGGSDA